MNNFVNFSKLSEEAYQNLENKDPGTFYLTECNLYLGNMLLSNNIATSDCPGMVMPGNNAYVDDKGKLQLVWDKVESSNTYKKFSEASTLEIISMIEAADRGELDLKQDCGWDIGQEHTITIPEISNVGTYSGQSWNVRSVQPEQEITLVLMEYGNSSIYKLVNPVKDTYKNDRITPSFIVGTKDCLAAKDSLHNSSTITNLWIDCNLRTWCNTGFYQAINSVLPGVFKEFNCLSFNVDSEIALESHDYFALHSIKDICNISSSATAIINQVEQDMIPILKYYYFEGSNVKHFNGVSCEYLTRSAIRASNSLGNYEDGVCVNTGEFKFGIVAENLRRGISLFGVI